MQLGGRYVMYFRGSRAQLHYVLFDEAQDGSGADIATVLRHADKVPIIFIGDPHQRLYAFRGADGAWLKLDGDEQVILLYDAFRYGAEVASVASAILLTKDETERIRGRGPRATIYRPLAPAAAMPYKAVIVHRRNAAIMQTLFQIGLGERGRKIYLKTARDGLKDASKARQLELLVDASRLCRGVRRTNPPWQLKRFKKWEALVSEVEVLQEDVSPKLLMDLVEMAEPLGQATFEEELGEVEQSIVGNEEAADLVLTRTHQIRVRSGLACGYSPVSGITGSDTRSDRFGRRLCGSLQEPS